MNTQRCDSVPDFAGPVRSAQAGQGIEKSLLRMHHELLVLRQQMHDLAEWHRAQASAASMPAELLEATQQSMDNLSDEAAALALGMSELPANSWTDIKYKMHALEYLLPEEDEPHVLLCRSLCDDIRRL